MRKPLRCFLAGSLALAAAASPVAAQWDGGPSWGPYRYNTPPPPYGDDAFDRDRPLPRRIVLNRLEAQGYDELGRIRFDGQVYIVEGLTAEGGPVRLVVDAYSGRLLRRVALTGPRLAPGGDDDGFDAPGRNGRSADRRDGLRFPTDEMPNAPRYLDRPGELGGPGRFADRPTEDDRPRALQGSRPADPRLAPGPGERIGELDEAPRRQASRPAPEPRTSSSSSEIQGLNPGATGSEPRARTGENAGRQSPPARAVVPPATVTSPAAPAPQPVPSIGAPKPEPGGTPPTETAERKPVRVIPGVTPLNAGEQSSPPPQNQLQSPAPR